MAFDGTAALDTARHRACLDGIDDRDEVGRDLQHLQSMRKVTGQVRVDNGHTEHTAQFATGVGRRRGLDSHY